MSVAFHVAAVNVRDATYFGIAFIFLPNSPASCSIDGHAFANPS